MKNKIVFDAYNFELVELNLKLSTFPKCLVYEYIFYVINKSRCETQIRYDYNAFCYLPNEITIILTIFITSVLNSFVQILLHSGEIVCVIQNEMIPRTLFQSKKKKL